MNDPFELLNELMNKLDQKIKHKQRMEKEVDGYMSTDHPKKEEKTSWLILPE